MVTAESRPLPEPRTAFIDREREVLELRGLLALRRLVTITGPGGVGKTRLALRLANEVAPRFRDGVFFVPLAGLAEPDVVPAICRALPLFDADHAPTPDGLAALLKDREILLLLDNFEQVIDASPVMASVLDAAPGIKLLVASQEPLHLQGEQRYALEPLEIGTESDVISPIGDENTLSLSPAVELFCDRARLVRPEFDANRQNLRLIADICRRLDGLPLAIELAAARVVVLDPEEILSRLEPRLDMLTQGPRDQAPRQRTLRATIEWSYGLLSPSEQELFEQAAVFSGGCTLEALEAVIEGNVQPSLLECVASLTAKSMLRREVADDPAEHRLTMLETTRQYALERLKAGGREELASEAHARYFLHLAEQAEARLHGPEQAIWLRRLRAEHGNLESALGWYQSREDHERLACLTAALGSCWWLSSKNRSGLAWCVRALHAEGLPPELRLRVASSAALLAIGIPDIEQARNLATESLELSAKLADRRAPAAALWVRGMALAWSGDLAGSINTIEASLALARQAGPDWMVSQALTELALVHWLQGEDSKLSGLLLESRTSALNLAHPYLLARCDQAAGYVAVSRGDLEEAALRLEHAAASYREIGHGSGFLLARRGLGFVALERGDVQAAHATFTEMLHAMQALGEDSGIARAMQDLGYASLVAGNYEQATEWFRNAIDKFVAFGAEGWVASCLESLAAVRFRQGEPEEAVRQFGAAQARRAPYGTGMYPLYRRAYTQILQELRESVGCERFRLLSDEGKSKPDLTSGSEAISDHDRRIGRADQRRQARYSQDLTIREIEILRLLATGAHNNEIAQRLIVSPYTVNNHLRSIYGKLEVHSRGAATRRALELGLV